jgi:predicted ATPase/DNA-binding CsgD family transcriptional regulator
VDTLQQLLRHTEIRLVTLTGPGGVGKTRLALQVATGLIEDFAEVFFVPLSSLLDPALVPSAIARALGLQEAGTKTLPEQLKAYLQQRHLLLVLDNFEHVLPAAPLISELLAACPALHVLVTSRAILHLSGEHQFPVQQLTLPDLAHLLPLDNLAQTPAVALCIQRMKSARPDFQLTEANARVVAEICTHLDGLPLAIELAAARIKLLSPQALLARMKYRLPLLTGGTQDLPTRQQTLRNTLEWSYSLLTSDEQHLFRRMAVFVGGCTLEALEAVCNREEVSAPEFLDRVGSLLDKSLLYQRAQGEGEPRFMMLATIREYALERLRESREEDAISAAHAAYYLTFAERGDLALRGPEQDGWLKQLEAEHHNLRTALHWFVEHREAESALRLSSALSWFWYLHGYLREGCEWLERVLVLPGASGRTVYRAKALYSFGGLARFLGNFTLACSRLEESLELWRELGDRQGYAYTLARLGTVLKLQGDLVVAHGLLEESVALFRELGDKWGLALALFGLGEVVTSKGDLPSAHRLLQESLALWQEVGDTWGLALALYGLGEVMRCQGDYEQAAKFYDESLALFRHLGNKWRIAYLLHNLGHVARAQENYEGMAALFEESFVLFRELGHKAGIAGCLAGLAAVAGVQEQQELAVQLFAASQALFTALGARLDPADRAEYDRNLTAIRTQLDEATFTVAWMQGQQMTWEQIIAAPERVKRKQDLPTSQPASNPVLSQVPATAAYPAGLTAREVEVLRHAAQGLSYAQIAERLIISARTVDAHLRSIYTKLGVTSRNEATRVAREHQLL